MLYIFLILIVFIYFINYFNILIFNHIVLTKLIISVSLLTLIKLTGSSRSMWVFKTLYALIAAYLYFNFWQFSIKSLTSIHTFIYLLQFNTWSYIL